MVDVSRERQQMRDAEDSATPSDRDPQPGMYRGTDDRQGPLLFALDVDGERFAVRRSHGGGFDYEWLSGPNRGYGFGLSGPPNPSVAEHEKAIRDFLAMIDPNTGYIEE